MLKPMIAGFAGQAQAVARNGERTSSMRWTLASLSLCMLLSSLGTSSANVALPVLAQAFGASFQQVQWVVLAYLLATTTLIVSVGRLGDSTGRRRLFLAGICLFTLASIFCGVAPTLWLLIAARALQGLGAASMMALALAFVGETIPKAKTGSAMGLLGTMSAIGTALGPSLGGVLLAGLSWRAIFLVNIPLGTLAFFLGAGALPADRRQPKSQRVAFDTLGTLLLALTLAAYALAMTRWHGSPGSSSSILLIVAVGGAVLFVLVEARTASPLLRWRMFREPGMSVSLVLSALVSTVMMATLVVGPFYLARALALNAALVGSVMSIGPITSMLMGIPAGRIVDRLGVPFMTLFGLSEMTVGLIALAVLPSRFGVAGYVAATVVLSPGYQFFQAANNTAIMQKVEPAKRGVVSALLSLSRNLGLITGAALLGAVFVRAAATTDITTAPPAAVTTGMQITFAVAALLTLIALAAALASRVFAARLSPSDERKIFG